MAASKRWSKRVTQTSNALDSRTNERIAKKIALAEALRPRAYDRRKADPFRSAMSMLFFYINRAGKGLSAERRRTLERAKDDLRKAFIRS